MRRARTRMVRIRIRIKTKACTPAVAVEDSAVRRPLGLKVAAQRRILCIRCIEKINNRKLQNG